jgi:hypothetical protein
MTSALTRWQLLLSSSILVVSLSPLCYPKPIGFPLAINLCVNITFAFSLFPMTDQFPVKPSVLRILVTLSILNGTVNCPQQYCRPPLQNSQG